MIRKLWTTYKIHFIAAIILAAGGFALNLSISRNMDKLGVYNQHNVLFDADPSFRIKNFQFGFGPGGHEWVHPNLTNLVHPPVRALASVLYHSGLIDKHPDLLRRDILMFIPPLAGMVTTLALFVLFTALGLDLISITLLCILQIAGFSSLIFNSMPEHFAISGMLFALLFLLVVVCMKQDRFYTFWWVLLAFIMTGIMLSNLPVIAVIWLALRYHLRGDLLKALKWVAGFIAAILVLNVGYAWVCNAKLLPKKKSVFDGTKHERFFVTSARQAAEKFVDFPHALVHSVAPPAPGLLHNTGALEYNPDAKYDITLTLRERRFPWTPVYSVAWIIMLLGAVFLFQNRHTRLLSLFALFTVIYNWLLHSLYGVETFLYSQHWMAALFLLISGWFWVPKRYRILVQIGIGLLIIGVTVNNILVFRNIYSILLTYPS